MHHERLCSLFKNHGGKVIMGNENAHNDKYLRFSVILNPDKGSKLMKDEIFGPIFPLLTYKNIDEAINYISKEMEDPLAVYYFGSITGHN